MDSFKTDKKIVCIYCPMYRTLVRLDSKNFHNENKLSIK